MMIYKSYEIRKGTEHVGKFIVRKTATGNKIWFAAATYGKVIATSEVYANEDSCLKGVESVKKKTLNR